MGIPCLCKESMANYEERDARRIKEGDMKRSGTTISRITKLMFNLDQQKVQKVKPV